MARNRLALTEAVTAYWYIQPKFASKADAEEACNMLQGLCDNHPLVVHEKKETRYGETIAGKFILEVFVLPNRSYHLEDIQAHLEERHHSANTAKSYLPQLVREGYLYTVGPQTYAKRPKADDTTPTIRADVTVEAPSDGQPAGLDFGETNCCGCGDEGHRPEDPGHRGS